MKSELKVVSSQALLIASSTAKALQTYIKQGVELKNIPLMGVLQDMKAYMKNYGNICQTLQTSRAKEKLLSKQYIISALLELFQSAYIIHLFYSGHGHEDGDWAIQIDHQPQLGRIKFEEMIEWWKKFRKNPSAVLNIYMDSCYSGSWVIKLQLLKDPSLNVNIYASCQQDRPSVSVSNHGGLFFKCLFDRSENIALNISKLTKYNQKPRFIEKAKLVDFDQNKIIQLRNYIRSTLDNTKQSDLIFSKYPNPSHDEFLSTQPSLNNLQQSIQIPHSLGNQSNPQQSPEKPKKQPGLYITILCPNCPHLSQFDIYKQKKGPLDLCEEKAKCYCPNCKKKLSPKSIKKIYICNIKVKVSGNEKIGQNQYKDRQLQYDATMKDNNEYVLINDVDELRHKWGWYEVVML